jgi:hypothetical protein
MLASESIAGWGADWAWGLPLIVSTVMIHALGLGFIKREADRAMPLILKHQVLSIGGVTLTITLLHGLEAFIWAIAFLRLHALPDSPTAMLYFMNALTAFGHTDVKLERQWQLLGAMESLNGWILFGLSTAYLFALIQRVWSQVSPGISITEEFADLIAIARRAVPPARPD